MNNWRPKNKEWVRKRSIYFERNHPNHRTRVRDYEAGADAMLDKLFELAFIIPLNSFFKSTLLNSLTGIFILFISFILIILTMISRKY